MDDLAAQRLQTAALLVAAGHRDAARERWRQLRARLEEIDIDPDSETEAIGTGSCSRPSRLGARWSVASTRPREEAAEQGCAGRTNTCTMTP